MLKNILMVILTVFLLTSLSGQEPKKEEGASINLAGVKMGTLLEYIARRESKPLIIDPAFPREEPVNIISPPGVSIPPDKLHQIIESTLRMKGYTIVTTESALKVVKSAEARQHPILVSSPEELEKLSKSDIIVTQIIPLKQADAMAISQMLNTLKSNEGNILVSAETNSLIITEFASNIRKFYEVIKQIDQAPAQYQTEVKKLKNTSVTVLRQGLNEYIQAMVSVTKPKSGVQARPFVSVDERTNSLIIFAQEEQLKQISGLIDALDAELPEKATRTYIYKLSNTSAEDVAKIVESIFMKPALAGGKPPEGLSIVPDKSANSLVITASSEIYARMEELLKQIDVKKKQVLIEAAIVELSMEKMLELGIELSSASDAGSKLKGFGDTDFNLSTKSATGKTPSDTTGLTVGVWKESAGKIPFLLKANQKDSGINLMAMPRLLANDNNEAMINIADSIPYDTKTMGPDGTVTGITFGGYQEAGIKLKIIPHIAEDGYLRLEIEQTTEQFFSSPYSETRPAKSIRTAKTIVTVPDKGTVIIGGLTRDDKTETVTKVPLLGDIPLLGAIFRSTKDEMKKTNLCIFITPHIMKEFSELIEKTGEDKEALDRIPKKAPSSEKK